jgi:hypothetical protein
MQRPIGIIWRGLVDITTRHTTKEKKKKTSLVAGYGRVTVSWGQKLNKRPSVRKRKDGNVEDNHNATLIATSSRWKWIQISPDSFIIIHKVDSERQQLQGAPVNQRPSHFIIQQTTHTHTHNLWPAATTSMSFISHFGWDFLLLLLLYEKVWRSYQQMLNNSDICPSRHSIGLFLQQIKRVLIQIDGAQITRDRIRKKV